jgi:GTPase SAR1 family protein
MAAAEEATSGGGKVHNIMLVGKSGIGKSTLSNLLIGDDMDGDKFKTSGSTEAVTMEVNCVSHTFEGGITVNVIDTPGIPDTKASKTLGHIDNIINYAKNNEISVILCVLPPDRLTEQEYGSLTVQSPIIKHLLKQASSSNISVKLLVQVKAKPSDPYEMVANIARSNAYKWYKAVYKEEETIELLPNTPGALSGREPNRLVNDMFPIIPVVYRRVSGDPDSVCKEVLHELSFSSGSAKFKSSCLTASERLEQFEKAQKGKISARESMDNAIDTLNSQINNVKREIREHTEMIRYHSSHAKTARWIPFYGLVAVTVCATKVSGARTSLREAELRLENLNLKLKGLDLETCLEEEKQSRKDFDAFNEAVKRG